MQSLQKEVRRGFQSPVMLKKTFPWTTMEIKSALMSWLRYRWSYMERFETLGTKTQGSCKIPPHQATRSCFIYKKLTFFSVPKQPANNLYMRNRQGTRNRMSICFLAFIARWSIKWSNLTNTLSIPKSFWINVTQSI